MYGNPSLPRHGTHTHGAITYMRRRGLQNTREHRCTTFGLVHPGHQIFERSKTHHSFIIEAKELRVFAVYMKETLTHSYNRFFAILRGSSQNFEFIFINGPIYLTEIFTQYVKSKK